MDSKSRRAFHRKLANHDYSEVSVNPFVGLRVHLSSPKLRMLSVPLFLCTITSGLNFIMYIYMAAEFQASARSIGMYLAFHGVTNALAQGLILKLLIPTWWNEKQATLITLLISGLQSMLIAVCTEAWELYIVNCLCCLGVIHYPSFKALIVKESLQLEDGDKYQANLQGALASIKTLAIALGSLLFPALYAYGAGLTPPLRSLPLLAAGVIYAASFVTLFFAVHDEDAEEEGSTISLRELESIVAATDDAIVNRGEGGIALPSMGGPIASNNSY
jgi:hypothetical protein